MQGDVRNRMWRRIGLAVVRALALGAALGGSAVVCARPQTTAPAGAETRATDDRISIGLAPAGEPAYTLEQAEAWRDEMVPHVEAVAGRTFIAPPVVVLADRDELATAIVEDSLVPTMAIRPQESRDTAELVLTLGAMERSSALTARYHRTRGVIQLPPGNLVPLMALAGEPDVPIDSMMKLILAHELAHALHAQHVDTSAQAAAVRTLQEHDALLATVEGFGMIVQERVAAALELEDDNAALLRVMSMENVERDPSAPRPEFFAKYYAPGLAFFRYHVEAGGMERVWAILEKPPVTLAQIREPATYGDPVEMEISLGRLFAGTAARLGAEGWSDQMRELTPDGAAVQFDSVDPEIARVFREDVRMVRTRSLVKRSLIGPQLRALSCYELERPAAGAAVIDAMVKLKDLQFKQRFADAEGITTEERASEEIPGLEVDRSMLYRITIEAGGDVAGGLERSEVLVAAAHRGDHVVQLTTSGGDVTDAAVAEVLDTLLERLESSAALVPVEPTDTSNPLSMALNAAGAPLSDSAWKKRIQEVQKSALAGVIGNDVQGNVVLEMSYVDARLATFEAPRRRQVLVIMLVQMGDAPAAELLGGAITRSMEARLAETGKIPGANVEMAEPEERDLGGEVRLWSRGVSITMPRRDAESMSMHVAHRGAYVAHVTATGTEITGDLIETAMTALFDALPDS